MVRVKKHPLRTGKTIIPQVPGFIFVLLSFAIIAISVTACNLPGSIPIIGSTPTPTNTPKPTNTPLPTATPTPLPTPTPIPEARIESGEHALRNGDWDSAMDEFQTAYSASIDPDIRTAALLGIGRTYYFDGLYYDAVITFEELVDIYPNSPHLAHAYYYLGNSQSSLGRHQEAAQSYQHYLDQNPPLIAGYIHDLRADELFSYGNYQDAAAAYQSALQYDNLLDNIWIELKMTRAYALSGDYQNALSHYDSIYQRTNNEYNKALIDLRKGEIFALLGQPEQAFAAFLDGVINYPTSYDSYLALVSLVESGIPVDELQRGIVDYYAGQYGVALAAIDRYLQNNPADPGSAFYFSGLANRALGGYQGAIDQWNKLIENYPDHPYWDEAWEEKAYTQWAYLDQYTFGMDTLLEFVSISPEHPRAAEFLFEAAQIAERAGRLEQAAELWQRVNTLYPGYENANRALFLAGISHYRTGNYDQAHTVFQMLGLEATNPEARAAAFLWIGKTKEAQGDEQGALQNWERAANYDPTGYYSERARDLLRGLEPFEPPLVYDVGYDLESERTQADEWLISTFNLPVDSNLSGLGPLAANPHILRGEELLALGMFNEARSEFEQLRQSIQSDPELTYRLMNYLLDAGLYRSAIFAARQVLDLAGLDDASSLNAPLYFNHIRFGTYYDDLVMPAAEEYNFHPLFLYSVIRQESLFESFIRSPAAASGLMQIIPSTGDEIAVNIGWPVGYTDDDLYRPLVSVKFGTDYLDTQRNNFEGDLYASLAAYNGGPGNAIRWVSLAGDDPDLFLEVIRYEETRDYIRSIYEIFSIYRRLYDRTP